VVCVVLVSTGRLVSLIHKQRSIASHRCNPLNTKPSNPPLNHPTPTKPPPHQAPVQHRHAPVGGLGPLRRLRHHRAPDLYRALAAAGRRDGGAGRGHAGAADGVHLLRAARHVQQPGGVRPVRGDNGGAPWVGPGVGVGVGLG